MDALLSEIRESNEQSDIVEHESFGDRDAKIESQKWDRNEAEMRQKDSWTMQHIKVGAMVKYLDELTRSYRFIFARVNILGALSGKKQNGHSVGE